MDITRYDFEAIPQLSALDKAYAQEVDSLRPFYQHPVQLEQFERIIQGKTPQAAVSPVKALLRDAICQKRKSSAYRKWMQQAQ